MPTSDAKKPTYVLSNLLIQIKYNIMTTSQKMENVSLSKDELRLIINALYKCQGDIINDESKNDLYDELDDLYKKISDVYYKDLCDVLTKISDRL